MEKIFRSMGDGLLMVGALFSKKHRSLDVPADQSDQVKRFKRWLSYEPSKHYLGAGQKKDTHK